MLNISIVTYNTDLNELKRCLESIDSGIVSKVYIIDNSDNSDIREFCAAYPKIEYQGNNNVGYGKAHNIAIRKSLATSGINYHLVLNSDILFEPSLLPRLIKVMERNESIGILQPRIVDADGAPQFTARALPSPFDLILRRFLPQGLFPERRKKYLLQNFDLTQPINAPNLQGSFMLLRCKAIEACGMFDERYFMYPEDIDLTRRIHQKYQTVYYPAEQITHFHRQASYHSFRMLWIHISNMIRYFNKWGWIFDKERAKVNNDIDYTK